LLLPFAVGVPFSSAVVPFAAAAPALLPFVVVVVPLGEKVVSWRTSSRTRRRRAGKEVTSPERRRERAWVCTAVGQLDLCECSAWRRLSWILFLVVREVGVSELMVGGGWAGLWGGRGMGVKGVGRAGLLGDMAFLY
jgi:hypothetical protein